MKKISLWLIVATLISSVAFSAPPTLRVAVSDYFPPFVMRANKQFYGFDISMMQYICKALQRQCVFIPMRFDKILMAVANHQVDVGTSAITISTERAKYVNFSIPYLPSQSQFITLTKNKPPTFDLQLFDRKNIGVQQNSVFANQVQSMHILQPTVTRFLDQEKLIEALMTENLDYGLIDAPSAYYWQSYSPSILSTYGPPLSFGIGYAIATNPQDSALLAAINQVLTTYVNTPAFQQNYDIYFSSLSGSAPVEIN